jgi:hypothetical protein
MNSQEPLGKWKFILKETKSRILLVLVLAIFLLIVVLLLGAEWWGFIEPIITFLTLGVVLFVWYQQISEEWAEDYLPKRFTGIFYFEGSEVMRFENANLTNEADIRALAQQIGSQMVGSINQTNPPQLKFAAPEVEVIGPKINRKEKYIHFTISFKLTDLPQGIAKNKNLIWKSPFMNNEGVPNLKY